MFGFVIPALNAQASVASVVEGLRQELAEAGLNAPILVIDDGSSDETGARARAAGAEVIRHDRNQGKGAALRTGMGWALDQDLNGVVSLDADGQHPPREAVRLLAHPFRPERPTLLLGVRDLRAARAPLKNQRSNRFSNQVLSSFGGEHLEDTQCGLRRYPLPQTLALGSTATGFDFESDVVLRAARRGLPIEHLKTDVIYPRESERVTHFDSVRDPAKIVWRVVRTTLSVPHHRAGRRWSRRIFAATLFILALTFAGHHLVRASTHLTPPALSSRQEALQVVDGLRLVGHSTAVRRQGIWEVHLRGSPEELGWAHGQLLRDRMVTSEGVLYSALDQHVPLSAGRALLLDVASYGYRNVDRGIAPERRRELAAQALAFSPDPFLDVFPTYQRFVYLSALYDISLSFEHSPLIGCTTFTVNGNRSADGSPLLARAFDFEVDPIFDTDKAVFFVEEEDRIPFASVAWPGLIGVVSGMNRDGLAVVVHGARAGPTQTEGEPVVHTLRRLLSRAPTTREALVLLSDNRPMVSHMLILQDAGGDAVVVERAVGSAPFVRALPLLGVVSNHLEGPLAPDPKNQLVRQTTSTLERRARGDALLAQAPLAIGPEEALAWLRDQQAPDGSPLPRGDRRAINARIATHGIITSSAARKLWVSRGPHLEGEFVEYDLAQLFAENMPLAPELRRPTLPAAPE